MLLSICSVAYHLIFIKGSKDIDTKVKSLQDKKATFNEKFEMKTGIDFDLNLNKFIAKPVSDLNMC